MYRVHLEEATHEELNRRAHQPNIAPRTRDRLEMVRLSAAGWSIPQIAGHLHYSDICVRRWIKTYLKDGFDALNDKPHLGQKSALTPPILAALREEIHKGERIWTARQVAEWLLEHYQIRRSTSQLRRLLRRERLRYKRTTRTLKHKQNQQQVAAKRTELDALEKGGSPLC